MSGFFKSPVLKAFLILVAIVLVSLAIWFIGPLVSFGGLIPLESVGMRVTTILMFLALVLFVMFHLPMHVLGMVALCILIWYASPLLAFGESKPFAPVWVRATIIGVLVFIYLVYCLYKIYELLRNDSNLKEKYLSPDKDKPQNLAKDEIRAIQVKADGALSSLKKMRLGALGAAGGISGFRRILEGKRYLYELPWYVIIGRPAAGKTTALLNSGLKFPVSEQMGAASAQASLAHNAGTTNCAWWFTNDAVLVDTAGRYTDPNDQASAVAKNAAEWQGFLGVLRKIRTRAPINGALLAVDVSQILEAEEDKRIKHAAMLRERLVELRQHLGIRFPVYVLVTKTDLLTGFNDYFSTLTAEGRSQVLGFTLPWAENRTWRNKVSKRKAEQANEMPHTGDGLVDSMRNAFGLLQMRLEDGINGRLQDEFDVQNRAKLYALPQEFGALSRELSSFLGLVFAESRFDDTQNTHMLRGVYLTSAQQVDSYVEADPKTLLSRFKYPFRRLEELRKKSQGILSGVFASSESLSLRQAEEAALNGIDEGGAETSGDQIVGSLETAPVAKTSPAKSSPAYAPRGKTIGQKSYFVSDVLTKVVFPEAGLVRPNLRWEANFRLLRLIGHALVATLLIWLGSAFMLSHGNNLDYLSQVSDKTKSLKKQVVDLYNKFNSDQVADVLTAAQDLPTYRGLDLADPSGAFTYGLYSAPPIVDASNLNYQNMQDALILPTLISRIETVLSASLNAKDSKATYNTLAVYLLLHDKERYAANPKAAANEIKAWVEKDWQGMSLTQQAGLDAQANAAISANNAVAGASNSRPTTSASAANNSTVSIRSMFPGGAKPVAASDAGTNGAATGLNAPMFGGRAAMLMHINNLFSGDRVVQSPKVKNEDLVQRARSFLDSNTASQRLYERLKNSVAADAPADFTIVRAVGPQAGTVFVRASHQPLEKGVPGLFTYDGYHNLFKKKLPEVIVQAQSDDDWVMGHRADTSKKSLGEAAQRLSASPLMEDIRRQYLNEYADRWQQFLADVRPVTGSNLAFDLNVLRQLSAPDSPLTKLARASARETTLSRPLQTKTEEDKSLLDKATDSVNKSVKEVNKNLGLNEGTRSEKELVDNRFSALREVVTGQSDGPVAATPQGQSAGGKMSMEAVTGLLNEFYTVMVVADTAAANNSLPANTTDATNKITMEAAKLPAPLKEVLTGIAISGSSKVNIAATTILHTQAQAQFDRLMGLLAVQVSDPCKRSLEGRYPFAGVADEVSVDDFNNMFASGGVIDDYFTKYLAPYVDTSSRPWRYKSPVQMAMQSLADSAASATPGSAQNINPNAPTLIGELLKLLAQQGPNPELFAKSKQIRDMFFREPGAKKLSWKVDLQVMSMDPTITELLVDIDGQVMRYAHGPIQPLHVVWPGPRGGSFAVMSASPKIRPDTSTLSERGPWAIMKLLAKGRNLSAATQGRAVSEFTFDGRKVSFDIQTPGAINPLNSDLIKTFKCPSR